ncbi:MAG: hypothetical protein K8S87_07095 [Planctomycetes bacterium]|nr:hypothetical protein [Planctomycetota bacterium]
MSLKRVFFILFMLMWFIASGCGGNDDPTSDEPGKAGFFTGSTDSRKIKKRNSTDSSNNYGVPEPYTQKELENQWHDNLDYVNKTIDKKSHRDYMVDPKGPGNSAIKATIEQVSSPEIYIKKIERIEKEKTIVRELAMAKLKFKITIENRGKQDCLKVSLKLYVYDKSGKRIIDKEQSFFYKNISTGKQISKEIVIDDFRARQIKKTKDYDVNFSKVELFVTNTKFYYN